MKKEFGEYRRLARGAFSCSSLWEGAEHLLYVKGTGVIFPVYEEYRRVRYSEIEAVTVARTGAGRFLVILSGVVLALAGFPAIALVVKLATGNYDSEGELVFSGIALVLAGMIALAALGVLVWNLVRGTSCHLGLQTREGVLRVRAANRLKPAVLVAAAVAARVESEQGGARLAGAGVPPIPGVAVSADPGAPPVAPPPVQ